MPLSQTSKRVILEGLYEAEREAWSTKIIWAHEIGKFRCQECGVADKDANHIEHELNCRFMSRLAEIAQAKRELREVSDAER